GAETRSCTERVEVPNPPPPILDVPPPLELECSARGGVPVADPRVQAWLSAASVSDACGPATVANDAPPLFPSGCGGGRTTVVTFTADDGCGNLVAATSTLAVKDSVAPVIRVQPSFP